MATSPLDHGATPRAAGFPLILSGLMLVMALAVIDANIVNTALPRIVADLGGMKLMAWAITAFLLATTVSAPLYGKLSDLYGRRRLMIAAIAVFLIGSLLCGAAGSMPQLILSRAVQGLGAGGLVTLVQATIGDLAAPNERGRYQAMFTTLFAICSLAGPLIGGALTTWLSWRWVFLINLPLGAVALALIWTSLPKLQSGKRHAIDFIGATLLAASTIALLMALDPGAIGRGALAGIGLAIVAVVGLMLFIRQEERAPEPILDLALFANRTFVIGVGATAIMSFGLLAALVLLPLYLQLAAGETPIAAAMIVTPQILGMVLSSSIGARLASGANHPARMLKIGVLLQAAALWSLTAGAALALPLWAFSAIAFVLGAGMGIGMPNAITVVQNAVRRDQLGIATGSISFFRSLGGAAGVAMSGAVVALALRAGLAGGHFGIGIDALLEHGARAAAALPPVEHARYIAAYAKAIGAGLALCALFVTGAFAMVLLIRPAHDADQAQAVQTD